jgi:hypothetical protein
VYLFEKLQSTTCHGVTPLWSRNYSKAERWVTKLVDPKDRTEFLRILPQLKKYAEERWTEFQTSADKIQQKAKSKELACSHLVGLTAGLASRPELSLLVAEHKRHKSLTPPEER